MVNLESPSSPRGGGDSEPSRRKMDLYRMDQIARLGNTPSPRDASVSPLLEHAAEAVCRSRPGVSDWIFLGLWRGGG
jgi:hypothetical protein